LTVSEPFGLGALLRSFKRDWTDVRNVDSGVVALFASVDEKSIIFYSAIDGLLVKGIFI
jgi:hypothetical protein